MRICVICEGSYPFVAGGVSSWLHEMIQSMPEHTFTIWAIAAQEKVRGKYAYTLPGNVLHVEEVYLDAVPKDFGKGKASYHLNDAQRHALTSLLACQTPDWRVIFDLFGADQKKSLGFLTSEDFLSIVEKNCLRDYPYVGFTDYFWTIRSMFLPLLYLLGGTIPEADIYHSVSAGYAGVLGAMAADRYQRPYVLTEHGIYTREREEEILRTNWVPPHFKDLWINMFYMFSRCAYNAADCVTSLFPAASHLQQELGCPAEKCSVIPNGVHHERFAHMQPKPDNGWIDIGAIVRVVPIKDIKTMLYAFSMVASAREDVRLHIMGPMDEDPEYYEECQQLMEDLQVPRVTFTGRVNVQEYMGRLDFTLLTSISEGQPLAVMESLAAARPAVTTDVGNCRDLLDGPHDSYGQAGYHVPVMHQTELADAMLTLCARPDLRLMMGENGRQRMQAMFGHATMIRRYLDIYGEAAALAKRKWS